MNIFENAKFGDKFRTRDGRMAIFVSQSKYGTATLLVQYLKGYEVFKCNEHGGHPNESESYESCYDIVSEWKEPIDERDLTDMATIAYRGTFIGEVSDTELFRKGFRAGYRKALEK